MTATRIDHNPACGTSRNVLALIRRAGVEPEVIEYLKTPPDRATLRALLAAMNLTPRQLLRRKGTPYDALLDAMLTHPILIEQPIVVTPRGTRLCRPSEAVLDLLSEGSLGAFSKEDGEAVIDAQGQRVR